MSHFCEMPLKDVPPDKIVEILKACKTVAIVGISDKPERDSHKIARYLLDHGFRIIPINPAVTAVLGQKSYPSLLDVREKIDLVDIFRKTEAIPAIVDEAIAIGAKVIWMQLGLAHNESAEKAQASGITVVQNKCIKIEHRKIQNDL